MAFSSKRFSFSYVNKKGPGWVREKDDVVVILRYGGTYVCFHESRVKSSRGWRCAWCNDYHCWKMDMATQVQILDKAGCISHCTYILFSLQLWVNSRADWFFNLGMATSLGEGKLKLLKNWPVQILPVQRGW